MHAATNTAPRADGRVVPWNKGKLIGQKPPLKLKEIWAIRIRLQLDHRARELALFNLAIDSKLRACDLVGLHVRDVFQGSHVAPRAIVMQKKTPAAGAIRDHRTNAGRGRCLDRGRPPEAGAVSLSEPRQRVTPSFYPAVFADRWIIGKVEWTCTHSLRRTKPTLIYRRTRNLRAVQLLLGHTKLESTVRYLGIEVDDALEIAEQTEV